MRIKCVLLTLKALTVLCGVILISCSDSSKKPSPAIVIATPERLYGKLFYDIQNSNISEFADSKTFCDVVPRYPVNEILRAYIVFKNKKDTAALKQFVVNNFNIPTYTSSFTDRSEIHHHIRVLWDFLTRRPDIPASGTLIPLPNRYVVPGGRFREVYYWDSYFTMLGLQVNNRHDLIRDMINNFAFLIDSLGYIPNGNRTYYLSRSQPPFFALMITLLASTENNDSVYLRYFRLLEKEYNYWTNGSDKLDKKSNTYRRLVKLDGDAVLNRYWDDWEIPRAESYKEDVKTAQAAKTKSGRKEEEVYRNIRAAAESGWDFSSRWFKDTSSMYTIHTTEIIPVDLNCLLYYLETILAKCYNLKNIPDSMTYFTDKFISRKKAINKYCWNPQKRFYMDYDFMQKKQTPVLSLAGAYPLFFEIANEEQARYVASTIRRVFLKQGGLVATTISTGEQWDAPNGWAPLHWITIRGLKNYNIKSLADSITERWMRLNIQVYYRTGKMLEKYNVVNIESGGGGEYPTQDGFGWTNGVFLKLSEE